MQNMKTELEDCDQLEAKCHANEEEKIIVDNFKLPHPASSQVTEMGKSSSEVNIYNIIVS